MSMQHKMPKNGQFILLCFLGFFGFIGAVDAYFVYTALTTNTGMVTEQPYEKGLAYNDILNKAKHQPEIKEESSYENGVFLWQANSMDGSPLEKADISVKFYRTVQDGYDFEKKLSESGNGLYQSKIDFPLPGIWIAKVNAQWNKKTYLASHQIMVK
jgi:nitrogen fixation protein FixH